MDNNTKVKVTSMVKGRVGVSLPELRFKREWPKMGTAIPVDMSILQEAIFDPGFSRMINDGILVIDDKEARIKLGLESGEDFMPLNEMQMIKLLKVSDIKEFEDTLKKMSGAQRRTLADIAIEKEIDSFDKTDLIKKYSGLDVRKTIELNRKDREEVPQTQEPRPARNPMI